MPLGNLLRLEQKKSFKSLLFQVDPCYDEQELQNLFDLLEARGAKWTLLPIDGGWVEIYLDQMLDETPYKQTLEDCSSVRYVEAHTEIKTVELSLDYFD